LKENAWDRAVRLAEYIVETKNTVRKTATTFGVSKSTVHTDVTKRDGQAGRKKRSPNLYSFVCKASFQGIVPAVCHNNILP
jgi:DNA invertase Pin-like site-specific DNA recombinase